MITARAGVAYMRCLSSPKLDHLEEDERLAAKFSATAKHAAPASAAESSAKNTKGGGTMHRFGPPEENGDRRARFNASDGRYALAKEWTPPARAAADSAAAVPPVGTNVAAKEWTPSAATAAAVPPAHPWERVPGGDVKEAVAASAEVDPAAPATASEGDAPPPRLRTERVDNVMGSQAGAGSSDFHIYRRHRRTEQKNSCVHRPLQHQLLEAPLHWQPQR